MVNLLSKKSRAEQILLVPQWDARPEGEREKYAPTIGGLQSLAARKIVIDPIGEKTDSRE